MSKKRRVVMFMPRMAVLVETGNKRHTIRRRANCGLGDVLSLRRWSARPRRSKQVVIREVVCTRVRGVQITADRRIVVEGLSNRMGWNEDVFARHDGFADRAEMVEWFHGRYGLPFEGELIEWKGTN